MSIVSVVTTVSGGAAGDATGTFVRGNVLLFSVTFSDAAGEPAEPDSATVSISTAPLGLTPITATLDLVEDTESHVWSAEWDTSAVAPGLVYWAVKSADPASADQGMFTLEANLANAAA